MMKRKFWHIITVSMCIWLLSIQAFAAEYLVPGGQVIGICLEDGCVRVAAFDEQLGKQAIADGLQDGDRILSINEIQIHSAADIRRALERADGFVKVLVERDGAKIPLEITPALTSQGPRLGIYLKQGVTGVGTVTWYDPDSGTFGALGHGVNSANGELLTMERGSAYPAGVQSVKKGETGAPGQLIGALRSTTAIGDIAKNTPQGIFGTSPIGWEGERLPVAGVDEIHTGPATIRSTVRGDVIQEYSVEILKIYPKAGASGRNLLLKVTDPTLLATTGGIVQGLSGSPIIQDGKLVGAVTHVLVNDPTTGYGIFIENMLDAAA